MEITNKNVEQVLEDADLLTSPPEDPEGGIPKPWLPEFLRKGIQCICYPIVQLDLAAQSIARLIVRPPFKKVGKCKRRGNCCYYIIFKKTKGPMGWIQRFWATQINGFYYRTKEPVTYLDKPIYVMGCRYFNKKDGSCGNYALRPTICRTWPIVSHFGWPRILKGCGYEVRATKTYYKMREKIEKEQLIQLGGKGS